MNQDQYLVENAAYERLWQEYLKYGSLVIAFDFDNTVFDFHNKGASYEQVIKLLWEAHKLEFHLICWTGCENETKVNDYLTVNAIPFDSINENPYFYRQKEGDPRKIYYNLLLDDRAGLIESYNLLKRLIDNIKSIEKSKNYMKNVITAPSNLSKITFHEGKVIFLAGSIEMGKATKWQTDFISKLVTAELLTENEDSVLVLNPRREDWNPSWEQKHEIPQFFQQVNWELNALEKSDKIVLYLEPNTKSPITLLELGLFAQSNKLLVCCPEGFWRKGNIDIVCERYEIQMFETLDEIVEHLKQINNKIH